MCGINPVENSPGFRKINLSPQPNQKLEWAKASLKSPSGLIKSEWKYTNAGLEYYFEIPYRSCADVTLQNAYSNPIIINGVEMPVGNCSRTSQDCTAKFELKAGKYKILVKV